MLKRLAFLALACLMLISLAACGGNEEATAPAPEVDLAAVKADIVSTLGITASDMNQVIMVNMYGLPENGIAASACFTAPGEVFNEEIFMFKATDAANADIIADKLTARLDTLKKQSESYSPETAAILEKAAVLRNDLYVAFFFSSDREQMESIYNAYF